MRPRQPNLPSPSHLLASPNGEFRAVSTGNPKSLTPRQPHVPPPAHLLASRNPDVRAVSTTKQMPTIPWSKPVSKKRAMPTASVELPIWKLFSELTPELNESVLRQETRNQESYEIAVCWEATFRQEYISTNWCLRRTATMSFQAM